MSKMALMPDFKGRKIDQEIENNSIYSLIARQLPPPPTRILAVRIELPDAMAINRLQRGDARELDGPAVLGCQRQKLGRGGHRGHIMIGFRETLPRCATASPKLASLAPSGSCPCRKLNLAGNWYRIGRCSCLMREVCSLIWLALVGAFRSQASLEAENMILRHQLNVLQRKSSKRPTFGMLDRLIFAGLYRLAPKVLGALAIVKPETVIKWHRAG